MLAVLGAFRVGRLCSHEEMCSRGRLFEGEEMLAISGCNLKMKVHDKICGLVYTPKHVVL
jgi:hypothetical protein